VAPEEIYFYPAPQEPEANEPLAPEPEAHIDTQAKDPEHREPISALLAIDLANLTAEQEEAASILIGGADKQIAKYEFSKDIPQETLAKAGRLIIDWGDPHIYHLIRDLVEAQGTDFPGTEIIAVSGDMAYMFSLIKKKHESYLPEAHGGFYDEVDEYENNPLAHTFDPKEYHHGDCTILNWVTPYLSPFLNFIEEQGLFKRPLYVDVEDYYLQFSMGVNI